MTAPLSATAPDAPPRFLMDAMLGRLARYARFVGCDTEYVAETETDEAVRERARVESRTLVTRDRTLASATPGAVLLRSADIEHQWQELLRAVPQLPQEVRFERCGLCNGPLRAYVRGTDPTREGALPPTRSEPDPPLFQCERCGQLYWEGSHTATVRARLQRWAGASP